jgi:tetratricopeptide (TPR) repeat protein
VYADRIGNYEEAYRCSCEAISYDPKSPLMYYNAGKSLLALKRTQEAYRFFNLALQLDPKYPSASHKKVLI